MPQRAAVLIAAWIPRKLARNQRYAQVMAFRNDIAAKQRRYWHKDKSEGRLAVAKQGTQGIMGVWALMLSTV